MRVSRCGRRAAVYHASGCAALRGRRVIGLRTLLTIIVAVAACAAGADTTFEPKHPAVPDTLRVGLYGNAPKIYRNDRGEPAGLFVELLDAIARREGWRLQYVDCDWAQCLKQLETGALDLMPDVAFSEKRRGRFDFHRIPVANSWSVLLYHPRNPLLGWTELAGRRIAILRGAVQVDEVARLMAGIGADYSLVYADTLHEAFDKVATGDADAVVSNRFFANFSGPSHGLRESPIVFNPATLFYATPKGRNGRVLERIDHYLSQWRTDTQSIYFEALNRTMVPLPTNVVPGWLPWLLVAATALLVAAALVGLFLRWQVAQRTRALQSTTQRLDHLLNASPALIYQLSYQAGEIVPVWVSDNIKGLFGFEPAQIQEPGWWIRQVHPEDREAALAHIGLLPQQRHLVQEYRIYDGHGDVRHIRDEMRFIAADGADNGEIIGSWNDVTEAREQAERLAFLTHFDPLTHLPNRLLLRDRLAQAIGQARRDNGHLSVLVIDLDRFKNINDTLGHPVGDEMLRSAATRMGELLRPGDLLARLGGDEFLLLMRHEASTNQTTQMARGILQTLSRPLAAREHQLVVTASIGISVFPSDGEDADTLLKHAEVALYEAKNQGRNDFRFFASALSVGGLERLVMETALRDAINRNELVLHYQPQFNLNTNVLAGVEALVRWRHPDIGLVPPGQFIPLAEETGIIGEIGVWVLDQACRDAVAWRAQGFIIPRVAVNISMQQIDPERLTGQVTAALRASGLDPAALELEVTESTIMREPDKATAALSALRKIGVKLAIDDFGTGYSSLAYLKRLPLDRLKIDRSFVQDIGHDKSDEAICRAVIGLARSLGLETVAEGIERADQADFLRREGCDIGQGYLLSRPLPADEFARLLQSKTGT